MENKILNFIQSNSPDGGFLQSDYWRKFQESVGRKTYDVSTSGDDGELIAYANIIEHILPIVGKYFYVPRGPVVKIFNFQFSIFKKFLNDLISNARKNNIGWIRIELNSEEGLNLIRESLSEEIKVKKSFVDMQPREILILDISKSEEEILAGMKQKTRYNVKLAQKKEVKIYDSREEKYIQEFLRLVKVTSQRDKITSHPESYYRKMFEEIPDNILKLYVAEFEGEIIAANLVLFFGGTATYMHGASDNENRNLMAPYLLQWQQIVDAKKAGCTQYDFGGVKIQPHPSPLLIKARGNSWSGITKFKTGFAPDVQPIQFPGSYDIMLRLGKYNLYRALQKLKRIF
jgi:peptidoglycan pentaglycine glycine transferase (the first glycine)